MQELIYERPTTVDEAVRLLGAAEARALAGGTDLVPQLREGRRHAARIVDLKHIPELTEVERTAGGGWRIGAAASVSRLARNADFKREHAGLLQSAAMIGSLQVQNRASLGGNLCNAAPSADAVPLLIALGAEAEIAGPSGRHRVPVESLPTGPGKTSLAPGEIVVTIHVPPPRQRSAARYLRLTPRREMDIAIAGAGACITLDDTGVIADARIVLASVAPLPLSVPSAAKILIGQRPSNDLFTATGAEASRAAKPISDTRGSAEYRRELVAVLTRRALAAAAADLGCQL